MARDAAICTEERRLELDVLQDMALAAINSVSPVGANLEEGLHALPTQVTAVVTHGVRHGATMALAAAQLRSGLDLNKVELVFPPKSSWEPASINCYSSLSYVYLCGPTPNLEEVVP